MILTMLGGAPHTDWVSSKSLKRMCKPAGFSAYSGTRENIDQELIFKARPRTKLIKTSWPRWFGLDIYVTATK